MITRGLAETARLAMALGANPLTLMGLAGLGDLVATCSSPLSRNRTFGEKLGQGMTTEEIYASTRQVAEGAKSCSSLLALAERTGVDAPIAEHVDAVVAGRMTAAGDDGRLHRPRHQGRDGLTARYVSPSSAVAQVVPEVLDVLDADRQPHQAVGDGGGLGLPAAAPLERRLDAAERGGVHPQPGLAGEQVGGHRALRPARSTTIAAEAGVADLADRRVLAEPADELLRRWPGPARPAGAGCAGRAARARPRTVPGIAPSRSRRPLSTPKSSSSRVTSAPMSDVAVAGEVLASPSARRCRRRASSGRWSRGVAKVLSTTT